MNAFTPLRTLLRAATLVAGFTLAGCATLDGYTATTPPSPAPLRGEFGAFVEGLWPEARAKGVSRATFDRAFAGIQPDPSVVALTRKQSEFVQPIWAYLNSAAAPERVAKGKAAAQKYADVLARIERQYGVPRSAVLGIWGMETNFGSFTGGKDVIRSLATLAHEGYRGDFFRNELVVALQILEERHIARDRMTGSWAGAMGQTQFMPSSFMKYAVDFDGDGRRDIWNSVPDALASTANYLKQHGWQPAAPWGVEVEMPHNFRFVHRRQSLAQWAQSGLKRAGGGALPASSAEAYLFFPAGVRGPAFLLTDNFIAIKAYNSSDAYALGVAHLGDRSVGGPALAGRWPVTEPHLTKQQTEEVQRRLNAMGFDNGDPDGRIGTKTREAVRRYQEKYNLIPDGYPTPALLERMRLASN